MDTRADDFTRLRGEIAQLHESLEAFVNDVRDGEAQRQKQAKKDTAERVGNERERMQQAKKDKAERVGNERERVQQAKAENAAAHEAWFGGTRRATAGRGTRRTAGRRSKAKAGAGTR